MTTVESFFSPTAAASQPWLRFFVAYAFIYRRDKSRGRLVDAKIGVTSFEMRGTWRGIESGCHGFVFYLDPRDAVRVVKLSGIEEYLTGQNPFKAVFPTVQLPRMTLPAAELPLEA